MIQQLRVRDLNSLANQLAPNSLLKEKLQKTVLDAVSFGIDKLAFDDQDRENAELLRLVAEALSKEQSTNESRSTLRRETEDEQETGG